MVIVINSDVALNELCNDINMELFSAVHRALINKLPGSLVALFQLLLQQRRYVLGGFVYYPELVFGFLCSTGKFGNEAG